jgi:VanZ family protein
MAEDINNLKIEVAVINEKLDSQSQKIDAVLDMLKEHIEEEKTRYNDIMDKKANVWVERFAVGMISAILMAFLGGVIALVFK